MILIVSHVYNTSSGPVYGPINVVENYLDAKKERHQSIKYPLTSKIPLPVKSLFEILNTFLGLILYRPNIFIGMDPLNAFSGVLAKKVGLVRKTVFYCVDYTPTRFKNKLFNFIYVWMDKFCAKNSDQVWNVSKRIVEVRKGQGVRKSKIKFVPNSPAFKDCPKVSPRKIDKNKIIMVAGLTHSPALDMTLRSFKEVLKKCPNIHLSIVGTGSYQAKLIKKIQKMQLSKKVSLMGQLPYKQLLEEVSRSVAALAIYTFSKDFSWVYYGDSKKAREYLACGTPVIITNVVGTSLDIEKYRAGIVIKPDVKELAEAIEKLVQDKRFWLKCRENAIKLGQEFDINTILDKVFKPLL